MQRCVKMKYCKSQKKPLPASTNDSKRRNEMRLNQIRHRRKQKDKFESLCNNIDTLKLNIRQLECSTVDFDQIVKHVKLDAARVRLKVVENLYALFEFGMGDVHQQLQFVNANMIDQVVLNGERKGRQLFWNQMRMLSTLYSNVQFEIVHVDVCGLTHEIIHVAARLHLQLNKTVMRMLYPCLNQQPAMVEFLDEKWMSVDLNQVYYFDGHYIQSINTDCDWISAWRKLSRSYTDVWTILRNANMDNCLFIHLNDMQKNTLQKIQFNQPNDTLPRL